MPMLELELASRRIQWASESTPAYRNYRGFRKEMVFDVEELDLLAARAESGEKLSLTDDQKIRMIRATRCCTNIYFILSADHALIKIGQAIDVSKRLSALRSSSPAPLSLLCSVRAFGEFEGFLHKQLADRRRHGEWFAADEFVLSVTEAAIDRGVRGVISALGLDIASL